jgi:hypothetical protein
MWTDGQKLLNNFMHFVQKLVNRLGSMVTEFSENNQWFAVHEAPGTKKRMISKNSAIFCQIWATRHQCKS